MGRMDVERLSRTGRTDVLLRSPVNWTAVLFFAALAALHLFMAAAAAINGRWDGYLSLIFGGMFGLIALGCGLFGTELTVMSGERRLRVRTGMRRVYLERSVPFDHIRSVRLTLLNARRPRSSTIELVCDQEVIECPPTSIPRQEALCLAMTIGTRLIKVYGDSYGPVSDRISKLSSPRDV